MKDCSINNKSSKWGTRRSVSGAGGQRDLTNINKVLLSKDRYVEIVDRNTGEIITLSKDQVRIGRMRKRVFSWADTLKEYIADTRRYRVVMIGLTYAPGQRWRPNHQRNFLLKYRKIIENGLIAYTWVGELQKRGAVHYHLLVVVKRGTNLPMPDKSGLWPWGSSNITTARSIYYICTYVGKEYQKNGPFPKGMRMFAVWIKKGVLSELELWKFRLSSLPGWMKEEIQRDPDLEGKKWVRDPGGGWKIGGKKFSSPYMFFRVC